MSNSAETPGSAPESTPETLHKSTDSETDISQVISTISAPTISTIQLGATTTTGSNNPTRHMRRSSRLSGRKFSTREFQLPKNLSHRWIAERSSSPAIIPGDDTSPDPPYNNTVAISPASLSRLQREAGSPAPCQSPQDPLIVVGGDLSATVPGASHRPEITINSPPPLGMAHHQQSPLSRPLKVPPEDATTATAEEEDEPQHHTGDICCECDDDDDDDDDDNVEVVIKVEDHSESITSNDNGVTLSSSSSPPPQPILPPPPSSSSSGIVVTPPQRVIRVPAMNRSKKIPIGRSGEDSPQFAMMSKSDPEEAENVARLRAMVSRERGDVIQDDEGEITTQGAVPGSNGSKNGGGNGGGGGGVRKMPVAMTLKSPRGVKKVVSSCRAKTPAMVTLQPVSKVGTGIAPGQEKEAEFKKGRYNPKDSFKEDYEIVRMLGDGATSKVLLAKNKNSGETVAIKAIPIDFMGRKEEFKKIAKEIPILKRLSHRNIIRYHDVIFSELYIAYGNELFYEITEENVFTERDAVEILSQVLSALKYIHARGVVHADLKPENIIVDRGEDGKETTVKLIDFGLSRFIGKPPSTTPTSTTPSIRGGGGSNSASCEEDDTITTNNTNSNENGDNDNDSGKPWKTPIGTLGYAAPELLEGAQPSREADMWAVGVITYILLGGYPPFASSAADEEVDAIICSPFWVLFNEDTEWLRDRICTADFSFRSPFWDDVSELAKDFVGSLLRVAPGDRMSAAEALEHPWITQNGGDSRERETPKKPGAVPTLVDDGYVCEDDGDDDYEYGEYEEYGRGEEYDEDGEYVLCRGEIGCLLDEFFANRPSINQLSSKIFQEPE